jgi:hypothetical protein
MTAGASTEAKISQARRPAIPERIEDLGISRAMVSDLVLRYLWLHNSASLASLNDKLKLSCPVLETFFHQFRLQQLLEVKGMVGNDYAFSLTASGRALAAERNTICQYAGPAPVSLQDYQRVVQAQAARVGLSRERLRRAFHDLVLPDELLDQLGPALIGHQSLFLYGETGSGKTSIAERIGRIYNDTVVVPYAVEVDGHIITLFDPVMHRRTPTDDELLDPRWVVCERPCITVGGELSSSMLELRIDEDTRVFISPFQMKANNGVLIIDDFGRQMLSPKDLLNRWTVPLDRRVDFLTLSSGLKFQVPFELMVVFSTNLDPHTLADEAFLRRIQTKVFIERVTPELFDQIFSRVVDRERVPCEPGAGEYLRERCEALSEGGQLRACYPMDVYKLVKAICEYEGHPALISKTNIERAVGLYFARKSRAGVED